MDLKLIEEKVHGILQEDGFRLDSLHYLFENGENYLRVVVDKYEKIISLDEIVKLSEKIDALLDEEALSDDKFILEVTTTGAEKNIPLHEVDHYLGLYIHITKKDGIKGAVTEEGLLQEISEDVLTMTVRDRSKTKEIKINRGDIKKVRRAIKM